MTESKKGLMHARLKNFFEQWALLPDEIGLQRPVNKQLDPKMLGEFFNAFQPALHKLGSSGTMANVWEAAGLKRNEVRVASALNWFLDHLADHGQQHHLCSAMLECLDVLVAKNPDKDNFANFPNALHLVDEYNRPSYRAVTEVCPEGEKENRVDIEISGSNLLLFMEVKIDAGQGLDQLPRYHGIVKTKSAGKRNWGVIYLTPTGRLPDNAHNLTNTIGLSWKDVATAFQKYAATLDENNFARHYIKQYADFVVNF